MQGWNSLLVRPEPLLIKDIKVQVNKQKPYNECPAQMKHNSDKMPIAPMSSQPCSKSNVSGSLRVSSSIKKYPFENFPLLERRRHHLIAWSYICEHNFSLVQ